MACSSAPSTPASFGRRDDFNYPGKAHATVVPAVQFVTVTQNGEVRAVARRKLHRSWADVRRALDIVRVFCPESPVTAGTHERTIRVAERYGYSIFDLFIFAAVLHSGAGTLCSEDMQDGQTIGGLTIRNLFALSDPVCWKAGVGQDFS